MKLLLLVILISTSSFSLAQTKVAVVKLLRGEVDVLTIGKTTKLKVNDWVTEGSIIRTAEKSFVKLIFIDKSQMNVGPGSEMKIETFSGKDSGVIDLVKGKIRSQVTKDYLQIKDRAKSKMFIKTQNAVMGVRGTDFLIATNGNNTSTILFEGEIAFNKLDQRGDLDTARLEEIVDRGVRMFPGEFSVMDGNRVMPTVPSLLNIQQREKLEKNQDFDSNRTPSNSETQSNKTVVPEGLSGEMVGNNVDTLKSEVAQISSVTGPEKNVTPSSSDPEGYVKGNLVKPANGSFVHVDSGIIIPPGPDSVLDSNTNTYIPGQDSGKVASDGTFIPPKNVEITNDGKILVAVPQAGTVVVKEVAPPQPIIRPGSVSLADLASAVRLGGVISRPGTDLPPPERFVPTGGIQGINDPTRLGDKVDALIRVRSN